MSETDDLSSWADDDLVRALRAPGTAHELADEEQVLAAFRAARPSIGVRSLPRRAARRLGAGGSAVVVTVALTSGVAAAYTGNLPDPVQRVVHSVLGPIGAPAPHANGPAHADPADPRPPHAPAPTTSPGATPSSSVSGTPTPGAPTGSPTASATGGAHGPRNPGGGLTPSPPSTSGPTSSAPPPPATPDASGLTLAGTDHRAGVGETVTLNGVVTDADGGPLSGHRVVLTVRGPRHWRAIAESVSDDSGAVVFTTPALTRSARFRLHTDHRVHSAPWSVRMVPLLATSVTVEGASTTVGGICQGCHGGDRVDLFRLVDHTPLLVRSGRLDASGTIQMQVATPVRSQRYAVRLPATPRHTAAHARFAITPPTAASVSISAVDHRVAVGQSLTLSGVVRASDGSPLPARRVSLQVRGPLRWRSLAQATTDPSGSVSFSTPAARRTTAYRLRAAGGVHSVAWRVAMVPTLDASASPDATTVTLTATVQGGRTGDRVMLLRRAGARLVRLRHASLGADGTVGFVVPHRRLDTTYAVRLVGTRTHAPAATQVGVPGTG
jgi:hypothetical protein